MLKINTRRFYYLFILLGLLSNTSLADQVDGLSYATLTTPEQQFVHILQVDPKKLSIIAAKSNENTPRRETLKEIAKYHNAIAAINGGFFQANGQPAGILKINKYFYSIAYRPRAAIGWSSDKVLIDRLQTKTDLYIGTKKMPVHAMNSPLSSKKAILYASSFNSSINNNHSLRGTHLIIRNSKILSIHRTGPYNIENGDYLYSIGKNITPDLSILKVNAPARLNIKVMPQLSPRDSTQWEKMDFIVGGAPLLIHDGDVVNNFQIEKVSVNFTNKRHARTAVGILKNKNWVFVVVENNSLLNHPGMTISELTNFMKGLGCESALNLDGGSSSSMYLNNKIINNMESEGGEHLNVALQRPLSDAILIVPNED